MKIIFCLMFSAALLFCNNLIASEESEEETCESSVSIVDQNKDTFTLDVNWEEDEQGNVTFSDCDKNNNKHKPKAKHKKNRRQKSKCMCSKNKNALAGPKAFR